MDEYIERAEIMRRFTYEQGDKIREMDEKGLLTTITFRDAKQLIHEIPSVDVALVVHGEWVRYKEPQNPYRGNGTSYKCSVCGRTAGHHQVKLYKYCPKCGAKMDGGEKPNE